MRGAAETDDPSSRGADRMEKPRIFLGSSGKQTKLIQGSPAEAGKELVRVLREEARVI